ISNSDTHADPAGLLRARGFLSVGHDEYCSLEMFQNGKGSIGKGLRPASLSATPCCSVSPMPPNGAGVPARTITRAGRYGGVSDVEKKYMGPLPIHEPKESTLSGG